MWGVEWDGMALDLGCHLFDNTDAESTRFLLDIAGGREAFVPVDVAYGNVYNGTLTPGLAVPDLTQDKDAAPARLMGLLEAISADHVPSAENLTDAVAQRFGQPLARDLTPLLAKIYAADPSTLGAQTLATSLFKRIRFLPDDMARVLKHAPEIDDRMALPVAGQHRGFYPDASAELPRNFYPADGGMRGFVGKACDRLEEMGVTFAMNAGALRYDDGVFRAEAIDVPSADLIVCTLSPLWAEQVFLGTQRLGAQVRGTPMVLYYFQTSTDNLGDLHYCHVFDPTLEAFRVSSPGAYGGARTADGQTYVCAECATPMDSALWAAPEGHAAVIWKQAQLAGVAAASGYHKLKVVKTPVSYSALLPGYPVVKKAVDDEIAQLGNHVVNLSSFAFTKLDIVSEVQKALT